MTKVVFREGRKWKGYQWLEEYDRCGCTNVQTTKRELPGYCPTHGNERVRAPMRMPTEKPLETGCH